MALVRGGLPRHDGGAGGRRHIGKDRPRKDQPRGFLPKVRIIKEGHRDILPRKERVGARPNDEADAASGRPAAGGGQSHRGAAGGGKLGVGAGSGAGLFGAEPHGLFQDFKKIRQAHRPCYEGRQAQRAAPQSLLLERRRRRHWDGEGAAGRPGRSS
mmetsp:Transcript_30861/g.46799  ORF Transcript_30861/g.46799 Transcript_30861/m.46799 type:complete len:157 (+) Transcript_30861:148-618(+)